MWIAAELAAAAADGLRREAAARDRAGEPHGLDSLHELALHPLIGEGLQRAGFGVWPEQRYPGDRSDGRRNRGRRCDLVLTPDGLPLTALSEAFWLEVKVAAQHGPEGPLPGYGSRLLQSTAWDVAKMADDPGLVYAGLLVLAFTDGETTARHDLEVFRLLALQAGLPLLSPALEGFDLLDRLGHGRATVALFPVLAGRP